MNIELTNEELEMLRDIVDSENGDEVWAKIELNKQTIESILSKLQKKDDNTTYRINKDDLPIRPEDGGQFTR